MTKADIAFEFKKNFIMKIIINMSAKHTRIKAASSILTLIGYR